MKIEEVLRQLFEGERQRSIAIVCPYPISFLQNGVFTVVSFASSRFVDEESENIYQVFSEINQSQWGCMRFDSVVFYNVPVDTFAISRVRSHKTLPKNNIVLLHEHEGRFHASALDTRYIQFKENNNEK